MGHVRIKLEALLATREHELEQRIMNGETQEAHVGRIALTARVPLSALRLTRELRTAYRMREVAALCARSGRHTEATALLHLSHRRRPLTRAIGPEVPLAVAALEMASTSDRSDSTRTADLEWRLAAGQMLLKTGAEDPWPRTLVELSRGAELDFATLAVEGGRVKGGLADPFAIGATVMYRTGQSFTRGAVLSNPFAGEGHRCFHFKTAHVRSAIPAFRVICMSSGGVGAVLREAAAAGCLELVDQLLAKKVSPFEADMQATTALHYAAAAGQEQVCRLLCQAGAVGFAVNARNLSAYALAVQNGHVRARRVFEPSASDRDLEEAARDEDSQEHMITDSGVTPLMRAARLGNLELVKALMMHVVTSQALRHASHVSGAAAPLDSDEGAELNMRSKRRCTALLMAAEEGHVEVMTALLENNVKLGLSADTSRSPVSVPALFLLCHCAYAKPIGSTHSEPWALERPSDCVYSYPTALSC